MDEPRAQRTLVKSPPELWAEISDVAALGRHLGEFGEIRITRLEPETAVAWEGDRARGTVQLEPSGWGTKVTLTARLDEDGGEAPAAATEQEPHAGASPPDAPAAEEPAEASAQPRRPGLFARLRARWRRRAEAEPAPVREPDPEPPPVSEPEPDGEPEPAPAPGAIDAARAEAILVEVLDDLGSARHRPFSRIG